MPSQASKAIRLVKQPGTNIHFEQSERLRLIRTSPIFADLPAAECTCMAAYARRRSFARNEVLFMQGEPIQTLILLESGWVKLTQGSDSGSEVILATRGPGDVVDILASPTETQHSVTARAAVVCRALTWSYPVVRDLVKTAQFNSNICGVLVKQSHELQDRYHEMSTEKVDRRLALTLIRLAVQCGTHTHVGMEVSVSRQDLALMTGTTLFAVSRLISKWSKARLIAAGRESFVMLNPQGLDQLTSNERTDDLRPRELSSYRSKSQLLS